MLRYSDDMAAGRVLTISQGTAPVSIEGQLAIGDWALALADPRPPAPERRRRVLRHAPRREIAHRQSCRSWDIDHAICTWVVTLNSPEEQTFYGQTLEEALAWCLGSLMDRRLAVTPRGSRRRPGQAGMSAMKTLDPTLRVVAPVGGHCGPCA
jgi:hypothetical protein